MQEVPIGARMRVAPPALDIVIVNWNSGPWLRECLRALADAKPAACRVTRVVVVDNASIDGSCDALGTSERPGASGRRDVFELPLTIVRNEMNRGFAAACNQGAAESRADYLLFLNPDTVPTAEALDGAIGLLEARAAESVKIAGVWLDSGGGPQTLWLKAFPTARTFMLQAIGRQRRWQETVALEETKSEVGSKVGSKVGSEVGSEVGRSTADDPFGAIEVAVVGGAFFVIAHSLFDELGGFDERFFMYFDELDLCLRARRHGARAMIASRIRIYHQSGASTDRVPGKRLFYLLRSRLRYARAHFSAPQTAALAALMCTTEPILRLGRAAAGLGPDRVRDVLEGYARFAASLAGITPDDHHHHSR